MSRVLGSLVGDPDNKRFWTAVLTLAVISRIVAVLLFGDLEHPYLYEYGAIARNLSDGYGYAMYYPSLELLQNQGLYRFAMPPPPTAFTLPGVVMVYYAVLFLCGSGALGIGLLFGCNILASIASLTGLYFLTKLIWDTRTARIAVVAGSVYPVFIYSVTTFGGTVFYHAVATVALCSIYASWKRRDATSVLLAAVMTSIWIYFRPEILFFSLIFTVYFAKRISRPSAVLYILVIALCMLPWTVRNHRSFDAVIPLTTNTWLNFWRGNNTEATGGSFDSRGANNWMNDRIAREIRDVPQSRSMELEISHIYREHALEYIAAEPLHAARLFLRKYLMFWTFDHSDPRTRNPVYLISYGILLLTFIIAFISLRSMLPRMLVILIGGYSLVVSLLHVETRYQTYVSILYIPFAAKFIAMKFMGKKNNTPEN